MFCFEISLCLLACRGSIYGSSLRCILDRVGFRGPFTRWLIGSANFLVVMNTAVQGDVIAIASDHAGFSLKVILREDIERKGFRALDLGTDSLDPADYPKIAESLALTVASGKARFGVVLCGTGIGVSIAANRHLGIRAALCHNVETVRLGRRHNDANVLALGARVIDEVTARACLQEFLVTEFEKAERHSRRVAMLDKAVNGTLL